MATDFLHGVETVVVDSGPRPIVVVRSAINGIICTRRDADVVKFPLDTPVLINLRGGSSGIGLTGSLPGARTGIPVFRDSQTIVGITPMILIAPGFT